MPHESYHTATQIMGRDTLDLKDTFFILTEMPVAKGRVLDTRCLSINEGVKDDQSLFPRSEEEGRRRRRG